MTNFEKHIKQSLEAFKPDVSNQQKSWESLQNKMLAQKRKKYFIGFGIAAATIIASAVLLNSAETNTIIKESLPEPQEKVIETKPSVAPVDEIKEKSTPQKATESPAKKENTVVKDDIQISEETFITPDSIIVTEEYDEAVTEEITIDKKDFVKSFNAEISVVNPSVCFGEKLQFKLNTQEPVAVQWHFSDGQRSEEPNPSILISRAGKYKAFVELTSLISGKVERFYIDNPIRVYPKAQFNIGVTELKSDNFERLYKLEVEGDEAVSVNWIGNKNLNHELLVELNERGNYQYTAEVFDVNGCKYTINKNFNVETDNNLLAPNAFTPNGDGVNDDFLPEALNNLAAGKFLVRIINPADGKLLFETSNPNYRWNGINPETGKPMQTGTYIWTAQIFGKQGNKTFAGKISVVD